MSYRYTDTELQDIDDPTEIPDEFYLKWMRMRYSLLLKRKRRVKEQSDTTHRYRRKSMA